MYDLVNNPLAMNSETDLPTLIDDELDVLSELAPLAGVAAVRQAFEPHLSAGAQFVRLMHVRMLRRRG